MNTNIQLSKLLGLAAMVCVLLDPAFCRSQTLQAIYNFTGGSDGGNPVAGLVFDTAGNLYGTTLNGGSVDCGLAQPCGVVFQLVNQNGTWRDNVLHSFNGLGGDGGYPTAPVALDRIGNVYGTTNCPQDCFFNAGGTLFRLQRSSDGTWSESSLVYLEGDGCAGTEYGTGAQVVCSVAFDHAGHLFAQTVTGGMSGPDCSQFGCGEVFYLTQRSALSWYQILAHDFMDSNTDGRFPQGLLAFDAGNDVYGTTGAGGSANAGTVYMLTPNHDNFGHHEKLLYSFQGGPSDGANPIAGVILDDLGNVYGTTSQGGSNGLGTVYMLTPQSNGTWTETVLYSFQGGNDAATPNSSLSFDAAGNLYGTAGGGANNQGTIFELTPAGGGRWTESLLHTFTGGADGGSPSGGVTIDSSGNIFGTASVGGAYNQGLVFEVAP
jgi:uncharacterized repeat protein (TIGR03803 family)